MQQWCFMACADQTGGARHCTGIELGCSKHPWLRVQLVGFRSFFVKSRRQLDVAPCSIALQHICSPSLIEGAISRC
jgi:hypothetical protein